MTQSRSEVVGRVGDYLAMLVHSYECEVSSPFGCPPESRLEYLGDHIFNFTTYDGEIAADFAATALDVCEAISRGTTFDYIETPERYRWYLAMCNMPFFSSRIEWGMSVRGAWWDHKDHEFDSCGLYQGHEQITGPLRFTRDEWLAFVDAMALFAADEMKARKSLGVSGGAEIDRREGGR